MHDGIEPKILYEAQHNNNQSIGGNIGSMLESEWIFLMGLFNNFT